MHNIGDTVTITAKVVQRDKAGNLRLHLPDNEVLRIHGDHAEALPVTPGPEVETRHIPGPATTRRARNR